MLFDIIKYFIFATRVSLEEVEGYRKEIENGANPRDVKMKLASEIVKFYHSDEDAKKAEDYFNKALSLDAGHEEAKRNLMKLRDQLKEHS